MKPLLRVENSSSISSCERSLFGRRSRSEGGRRRQLRCRSGETLALVGESAAARSTLGRLMLRLIEPRRAASSSTAATSARLKRHELRGCAGSCRSIFQDPYASLNPRMTVGQMLTEPLILHGLAPASASRARRRAAAPGRLAPTFAAQRYPHEFSGGQRQRIAHRARTRRRAEAHHLRRAGVGARRLDPGAGRQPAARSAAALRSDLHLHLARSRGRQAHRQPRRGDVSRARSSNGRRRTSCSRRRAIPTPRPCCRRSRCRSRRCAGSASFCTATCRAPSSRRPAAGSIPAAPLPSSAAEARRRRFCLTQKGMPPPATASAGCRRSSRCAAPASPRNWRA